METELHFQIQNRVDREFGMVPRAIWRMDLPAAAKACAAYLFCLRDGATPYVAQIEAETGLGRDARRKAFAALEAVGLIRWHVQRDQTGRIFSKTLVLDASAVRAPENQAHGENHRAPEKPADGKSTPPEGETRSRRDVGSGDKKREEKKERAVKARAAVAQSSARASVRSHRAKRQSPRKVHPADISAAYAALSHPATPQAEQDEIWRWLASVQPQPDALAPDAALRCAEKGELQHGCATA